MYKKILSTLLTLCMALTLMPVAVASTVDEKESEPAYTNDTMSGSITATATANASGARMTLQQLKDKFPDGRYWNGGNVDSTTGSPCPSHATTQYCNHFKTDGNDASQCYGFALKLGYDAYGTSPRSWEYTKENSYVDSGKLKPGDIISSDAPKDHTVFVIDVTDTQVIVGECNWGKNCIIRWGRAINKSEIRNWTIFKIYIAPSDLSPDGDTPAPTPPPQKVDLRLGAWISESRESLEKASNSRITQGSVGKFYYLWFKLYDQNTGKLLNELYPSTDYNSNMTIIAPDGTQHTTDYSKSDNNWRGFPVSTAGNYTCKVKITGGMIGEQTLSFAVPEDKLVMTPDKTSITVELGKSAVCNLTASRTAQTKYVDKTVANGDICAASFGELSCPSDNTVLIPMHITGKKVGQTTVTAHILDPNKNKLVSSSPITVTVTEPASKPAVTLDKNAISIMTGEKASINAAFQTNGVSMNAGYKIEDSAICTAAWDKSGSSGNRLKLDIFGLSAGTTNITVNLLDSNGNTVASQPIAVSVSAKPQDTVPLKLSASVSSISVEEGDSQPVEVSWSGTVPAGSKISVSATPDPNRAGSVSLRWGNKGSSSRTIMVTGNREGGSTLNIALTGSNGNILASISVSVTVSAKKKEASVSLSPASTTMKFLENRTIIANYQGDYYKRVIESGGSGVFIASMDGTDYPGSFETINVTGIKAGTGACRVVLQDEYGNELASAVLNVTVLDDTNLDDGIDSDEPTYTTPGIPVGGPMVAQSAARSAREYGSELEDEIASGGSLTGQGGGQNQALTGFSASGSMEIKTDNAAANVGINTGKNEQAAIKDIPAGTSTNAGAGTGTSSITVSVAISDPAASSPSGTTQSLRFTDVISGKYYYEPVVWAEQTGVTAGITGTTLNPNGNCPRGQVVEFIWRTLGSPKPKLAENPFTDVDSNDSYYDAVLWAYESNVTTGTSKIAFSPNDTCTRGQVMTFLWRAKGKPAVSGGNPFTDVTDTAYYADAVNWAVETAITTGTSATSFSPKDLCSRAQILTFLYRSISGGVGKS